MDVIILGAGIVGLTLANLLAQDSRLKIAVIEAKMPNFVWDDFTHDLRCSAITRASQNVFKHLGIWDEIVAAGVGVYEKMQVWNQLDSGMIDFAAADIIETDLGHIIENRVIHKALWDCSKKFKNMQIMQGQATKFENLAYGIRLHFSDEHLDAKLIVGADGANSWLRAFANIATHDYDYCQSALVANIRTQYAHDKTARQCFTESGPLAFLPLQDNNLCSIVWSAAEDKIRGLMQAGKLEFCTLLAHEFAYKLGNLELESERACFALRRLHAKDYVVQRIALIGDAAHVVHPLLGQGMNLGVMDAATLAEVLDLAERRNKDIGNVAVLRKYERWRKVHNLSVMAVAEGLQRSYQTQSSVLRNLRQYTMRLANDFSYSKQMLIRFAMGLAGDLPASAKCY
jgi:2-octaprenylphenol hydroxylase